MKTKFMTKEEAIKEGYTYCTPAYGDSHLTEISDCTLDKRYVLVHKEPSPFQISGDLISELLDDWLASQDEVADEDGHLNDLAAEVDFSAITEAINKAFSNTKFYHPTDIYLKK